MLTESVSDPRRANWLTITSMCEDVFWPEENNASRPSWELEAEILRLTTRLMMRERELRQVKSQLKSQSSRAQQQAFNWRRKVEEKEEQMKSLLCQKDAEMQGIMSQLALFEAELRQEQARIESLLSEKDAQIQHQNEVIERLKRELGTSDDHNDSTGDNRVTTSDIGGDSAVRKLRDELFKIRAIQDVTNVRTMDEKTPDDDGVSEKKRPPYKAPQKMKDLKARRTNLHKTHRQVMSEICGQAIL